MEVVSKQIEAQAQPIKTDMNRYEKSLILLASAMNLLNENTDDYLEAIVEVAKCKRLLAVNKKHIRGVWRQDAIEIEEMVSQNMQEELKQKAKDSAFKSSEIEGSSEVKGDFEDKFMNYKDQALQSFVEILQNENLYQRIIKSDRDSILSTLSLEYTECRGNLNKEQAFFYLGLH